MNAALQIGIGLAAIGALLGTMAAVKALAAQWGWSAEVQRKTVHICTGLFAMTLPWIFAADWPVYVMLGFTMLAMLALRLPAVRSRGIGGTLHSVNRQSYGDFLLALAVGLVFLFAGREPILYLLPLAVLTLGDAAAALAGSAYGRRMFRVEDGMKSVEGSVIFFLVTMLLSMILILLLTDTSRVNVIVLSVLISGFATLVEADSWRGFDNLFLPMGILICLAVLLDQPSDMVLITAFGFVAALVIFTGISSFLGLTRHAARVYVIAAFLILLLTEMQNAVLPLLALLAHAAARRFAPETARHPDLDFVAALALICFGFLAAGEGTGLNALNFFALACAALTLLLISLALSPLPTFQAAGLQLLCAVGLAFIWGWAVLLNPGHTRWHPDLNTWGAPFLTLCLFLPALFTEVFTTHRAAKIAVIAALPPLALYFVFAFSEMSL